ncbi:molybdenum cofactor sulfurylase [Streptomyces sp. 2132.2]|uniref:xanthine dehydrogenase accessory protein XdhC n=1 Tax=Streptomyces sp. 2132.2 TaxID=2485161 RepID=UPI000F4ABB17|nr:xanthine dehydrogenase accessory protein XdhC [Streptomyces sp. 2132.2]ROQ93886.1 molybdenum cofactor sulfurylase [Streptomyces sp. 2132.2]
MSWVAAVARLRARREPGVLVTVATVRGHAPRRAGAKLVVGRTETWGSIGGGNIEAVAVDRARELIGAAAAEPESEPELMEFALNDKVTGRHGVQCCGGAVTVLLEPLPVVQAVAVFGVGHVGLELARILARHHLDLHLIDTRPDMLTDERLGVLADAVAQVHVHHTPLLPEAVLAELPPGAHVLIMTHDHAEDAALCDAALRTAGLGSIGLIGSSAKWARFRQRLATEGGHDAAAIDRIKTPIGISGITGKEPATIAVSVAADLLRSFERDSAKSQAVTGQAVAGQAVVGAVRLARASDALTVA